MQNILKTGVSLTYPITNFGSYFKVFVMRTVFEDKSRDKSSRDKSSRDKSSRDKQWRCYRTLAVSVGLLGLG